MIKIRYSSDVYYIQFPNMFTDSDKEKHVECEWSKEKQRADPYFLDSLLFSVKIRFFSTLSEVLNKIIPIVERNTCFIYGNLLQGRYWQIEPSLLEF